MRIAIASDHAGFIQKDPLADYLRSRGHETTLTLPTRSPASSRAARLSAACSSAGRGSASP